MCEINVLCRNFLSIHLHVNPLTKKNLFLRLRDKRLQESEALENMGKIQDSWCKKSQAVSVVYEHIAGLIEVRKKIRKETIKRSRIY